MPPSDKHPGLQHMIPRRKFRWRWPTLECVVAIVVCSGTGALAQEISFNRDIRPILAERCFACHGADTNKRKAKLRLDRATGAD